MDKTTDIHEKIAAPDQYAEIDDIAELAEAKREHEVISEIDHDEYDTKKARLICDYERQLCNLRRQFSIDMEELAIQYAANIGDGDLVGLAGEIAVAMRKPLVKELLDLMSEILS